MSNFYTACPVLMEVVLFSCFTILPSYKTIQHCLSIQRLHTLTNVPFQFIHASESQLALMVIKLIDTHASNSHLHNSGDNKYYTRVYISTRLQVQIRKRKWKLSSVLTLKIFMESSNEAFHTCLIKDKNLAYNRA